MTTTRSPRRTGPIVAMVAGGLAFVASFALSPALGADEGPEITLPTVVHDSGGATTTTVHESGGVTTTTVPETTTTVPETTTTVPETTTTTVPETTTTTVPETTTTVPETTTTAAETSTTVAESTTTVPAVVKDSSSQRPASPLAFTGSNSTSLAMLGGALFVAGLSVLVFRSKRAQTA